MDQQTGNQLFILMHEDIDLSIQFEIIKNLGSQCGLCKLNYLPSFFGGQPLNKFGCPGWMKSRAEFNQFWLIMLGEHFAQFG
jgi:hypothetical protein